MPRKTDLFGSVLTGVCDDDDQALFEGPQKNWIGWCWLEQAVSLQLENLFSLQDFLRPWKNHSHKMGFKCHARDLYRCITLSTLNHHSWSNHPLSTETQMCFAVGEKWVLSREFPHTVDRKNILKALWMYISPLNPIKSLHVIFHNGFMTWINCPTKPVISMVWIPPTRISGAVGPGTCPTSSEALAGSERCGTKHGTFRSITVGIGSRNRRSFSTLKQGKQTAFC